MKIIKYTFIKTKNILNKKITMVIFGKTKN